MTRAGGDASGVRVFAGPRWDPFIMDAPAMLRTIATGKLAFTDPSSIFLDGKNVLSLVVEVDCARVLGDGQLYGVVAETLTRNSPTVRFERAGRPEVLVITCSHCHRDGRHRDEVALHDLGLELVAEQRQRRVDRRRTPTGRRSRSSSSCTGTARPRCRAARSTAWGNVAGTDRLAHSNSWSRSACVPWPSTMRCMMRSSHVPPSRHGTHLPHDSWA